MNNRLLNRLEVKDLSDDKGIVSFYYSAFNNADLGGDIVLPSAFKKTVNENKSHIYHNRDHSEAVGKPLEFGQDSRGAYCVSQLAIKTADGLDCYEQYKAGIIKGHSMEYNAIKWAYDEKTDTRTLTECMLWGVTSVTNIPMNLDATTISVKSYTDVLHSMEEIGRFLKHGNISEKTGIAFLEQYDKLKVLAKSLKEKLKAGGTTFSDTPQPTKASINYKSIISKL